MGSLPWSAFKVKLNERFTFTTISSLHQSDGLEAMRRYVQTFATLFELHSNERRVCTKGGLPTHLVTLGLQCHLVDE